jgi:hypothetical protein
MSNIHTRGALYHQVKKDTQIFKWEGHVVSTTQIKKTNIQTQGALYHQVKKDTQIFKREGHGVSTTQIKKDTLKRIQFKGLHNYRRDNKRQ